MVMRGVNHHQVIDNIHGFVARRRHLGSHGPVIETVFLCLPENASESRQFAAYWRSAVDHVRINSMSRQFAEFKSETRLQRPVRRRTCAYLWDRLLVFWNGDVTVCIADLDGAYCLGNLRNRSICDMWDCEALESVRRNHRRKRFAEVPLCSTCDW
jgi:radical SAM protein with 4Fe4S-binding SPASM domain